MLVVIPGCANADVTCHDSELFQPLLRDFLPFLATDEAFFPSAVRTDFGKCPIVRFLLAADAAFFMFFRAAFLCLVETICSYPLLCSRRAQ
jgi:hypothetical protein